MSLQPVKSMAASTDGNNNPSPRIMIPFYCHYRRRRVHKIAIFLLLYLSHTINWNSSVKTIRTCDPRLSIQPSLLDSFVAVLEENHDTVLSVTFHKRTGYVVIIE